MRETKVRLTFSPPQITVWNWRKLYSALGKTGKPCVSVVVRHELWPAFLSTAADAGKLLLIDAAASRNATASSLGNAIKGRLLRIFDSIHTVSEAEAEALAREYGFPKAAISASGDTKYDRAVERAEQSRAKIQEFRRTLEATTKAKRLIIGSAWPADYTLAVQALTASEQLRNNWTAIIALHQPTRAHLAELAEACRDQGLSYQYWSKLDQKQPADVLIIDAMGILSELYGAADLAFVGGGLHHKVHNVLEPAIHGLPVAFGPRFKNSHEAISMVNQGIAVPISDLEAFMVWWLDESGHAAGRGRTREHIQALIGASQVIFEQIRPHDLDTESK